MVGGIVFYSLPVVRFFAIALSGVLTSAQVFLYLNLNGTSIAADELNALC